MPNYEYRCRRCGKFFDAVKSVLKRGDLETCPKCGGEALRKFTPTNFLMPNERPVDPKEL